MRWVGEMSICCSFERCSDRFKDGMLRPWSLDGDYTHYGRAWVNYNFVEYVVVATTCVSCTPGGNAMSSKSSFESLFHIHMLQTLTINANFMLDCFHSSYSDAFSFHGWITSKIIHSPDRVLYLL